MKNLEFCEKHNEVLQFFCLDCDKNICSSCVENHAGHKIVKQNHSLPLLMKKIENGKMRLEERLKLFNDYQDI
jgi:hypothetical protein